VLVRLPVLVMAVRQRGHADANFPPRAVRRVPDRAARLLHSPRPRPRWRWWARVTVAAPVILLVPVAFASGPLDPKYQAVGGPFDFRGGRDPGGGRGVPAGPPPRPAGGRPDHAADPDVPVASASSRNDVGTAAWYNHVAGSVADALAAAGER
jgi:hypothetical protein